MGGKRGAVFAPRGGKGCREDGTLWLRAGVCPLELVASTLCLVLRPLGVWSYAF